MFTGVLTALVTPFREGKVDVPALKEMVADLASANWQDDFSMLELPPYLKNALIVHKGELTPQYRYLHQHLEA